MGGFLLLISSIILSIFLFSSGSILSYFLETNENVQKYKQADETLKKIDEIENSINIDSYIGNINRNKLTNISILQQKPISTFISDTKGIDPNIINKYAAAAKKILDDYPNANDDFLNCERLASTQLITSEECKIVKGQNFGVFSLEEGKIKYEVSSEQAVMINEIQSNRKTNLDANIIFDYNQSIDDNNTVVVTRSITTDSDAFNKETEKINKSIQEAEMLIAQSRYDVANQVLLDIEKLGVNIDKVPQLRNEIVFRKLFEDGTITVNEDEIEAKMINQDVSILPQTIKESIIKTVAQISSSGLKKYESNEDSIILLKKIGEDLSENESNYKNLSSFEKKRFFSILEKL